MKKKYSEKQLRAIRANYARIARNNKHIPATYPHFRYYLKSRHPALIIGEQPIDEYQYRKVMHAEKDGRHLNEKIEPNPNPKDTRPMYIAKRVRHDKKANFESLPLPWKYLKNK